MNAQVIAAGQALMELAQEAERLSQLAGNKGREVRRFFERVFLLDAMQIDVQVQFELPVEKALYVNIISRFVALANSAAEVTNEQEVAQFKYTAAAYDVLNNNVAILVSLVNPLPEGMKERQALLYQFGFSLRRIAMMMLMVDADYMAEERRKYFLAFESGADAENRYLPLFDKLMNNDFSSMDKTPFRIVDLAALINPAVARELDACIEELKQEEVMA